MQDEITLNITELKQSVTVVVSESGIPGPMGPMGLPGTDGQGVPASGVQFALLQKKTNSDFDTEWTNNPTFQSYKMDLVNQPSGLVEGESRWNPALRVIETSLGDNVILQNGLELYIRGANYTGQTIPNGSTVVFSGSDPANDVNKIQKAIGDSNALPYLFAGVATEDMTDGGDVHLVTSFGEVHDLNTTGSLYGETWNAGDPLFVHPLFSGGLTNQEPIPPNVSIPVGFVVIKDAIEGSILVRPSLFPRLMYGGFYSNQDQTQTVINTPKAVTFNGTQFSSGIRVGSPNSRIYADRTGLYNIQFSLQLTKTTSSVGNIWIWPRVDGVDVTNSNSQKSIAGSSTTDVPSWNFLIPMSGGQYFELMWAVDTTQIFLDADVAPAFGPAVPSALLSVQRINQ